MAQGTRKTTNAMIHQPKAAGPADWMTAALVMNKTIATKMATMSKVVSTRGRMPPATRSDSSSSSLVGSVEAVIGAPSPVVRLRQSLLTTIRRVWAAVNRAFHSAGGRVRGLVVGAALGIEARALRHGLSELPVVHVGYRARRAHRP